MRKKSLREGARDRLAAAQAPESISRDNGIGGWVAARHASGLRAVGGFVGQLWTEVRCRTCGGPSRLWVTSVMAHDRPAVA